METSTMTLAYKFPSLSLSFLMELTLEYIRRQAAVFATHLSSIMSNCEVDIPAW